MTADKECPNCRESDDADDEIAPALLERESTDGRDHRNSLDAERADLFQDYIGIFKTEFGTAPGLMQQVESLLDHGALSS